MNMRTRVQGGWVPIPEPILLQLRWPEGAQLDLEVVSGTLLVTQAIMQNPLLPPPALIEKRRIL